MSPRPVTTSPSFWRGSARRSHRWPPEVHRRDEDGGVISTQRMRILNAAQMREADRRTIEDIGIPSLVLMENAGRQVVAAIEAVHSDLVERKVAVLCGR